MLEVNKAGKMLENYIILRMQADFMLWEQCIEPSLEAMRTLLPFLTQTPRCQTASTYPTGSLYKDHTLEVTPFLIITAAGHTQPGPCTQHSLM